LDEEEMTTTSPSDVTLILMRLQDGDRQAADDLLRALYDDLRRVAAARLAGERSGHSFQPTELVHEAYLRLVKPEGFPHWNSRRHFFTAAAEAMRRILIDHAREKKAAKRGGQYVRVNLADELIPDERKAERLLALEEALAGLEARYPEKAALVKLRFFAGCTIHEAAELLGISTTTADRHWAYARAWLKTEMQGGGPEG
jgi:RNA polymerase sigma factor (TIGR02999 family)